MSDNLSLNTNYFIHDRACVETTDIGAGSQIMAFAVVGANVRIGERAIVHPHTTIAPGVTIGDGVEVFPGAYIGKEPKGAGATARQVSFSRHIVIGNNCTIGPHSTIYYDVEIGNNTLIGDNASIREQVRIGEFCILSRGVTVNYHTRIGNRTKIMDLTHITGNCDIGDDVFISVLVATTNDRAIGKMEYAEDRIQGPQIGDRVAIGAGANLLPGVKIGEGAIVAAAAVVSKDISPGKMVAGNPARTIKSVGNSDE